MKQVAQLLFLVCLTVCLTTYSQAKSRTHKAVFIIVDGIPADVIEKLPTPNLDSIAKVGGYSRSFVGGEKGEYSQTPTISAVGYNSLLTGTWVNKHNVWGNDIAAPNYHYPTIFQLFKETYPNKKTAIFSSWLDNRTKLVGDKLPATGNFALDIHYDGLELDTARFPHDERKQYMEKIDESVSQQAAQSLEKEAPDLSWVYLEYTDDMGHMYGDGSQFNEAVQLADRKVGTIWRAIQYRQQHFNEDWMIVVTTDHGRDAATGKNHGGQSERERSSWIFTNAQNLNASFKAPETSIVDIAPTLARFLDVPIKVEQQREMDGVPLIGKISILAPQAFYQSGKINLSWKAVNPKGEMKVWLAKTNDFKNGGLDTYYLVSQLFMKSEKAEIDVSKYPANFYKIVLEAPNNTLNRWVIVKP